MNGQRGANVLKTVVLGDGQETDTAQVLSAGTPSSHRRGSATHSLALRSSGTNQECDGRRVAGAFHLKDYKYI